MKNRRPDILEDGSTLDFPDPDPVLCDGCGAGARARVPGEPPKGWCIHSVPDLGASESLLCRQCSISETQRLRDAALSTDPGRAA